MFGRWLRSSSAAEAPQGAAGLHAVIRQHLHEADDETVRVIAAIAGLVGAVAYADREYTTGEEGHLRSELARIHGMTGAGIEAVCSLLRLHIVEVATVQAPRYARELLELGDLELRLEVLQVLVDVAASDGRITHLETNVLRQLTTALGLTQHDYNAAQVRHRDKLSALKPR
jgi:uncharacterized tellurite resistance protein B-like protein